MAEEEGVAITLLRSIDASLKQLVSQQQRALPKPIATDRDMDGKFGNPILKVLPRDWVGPSFKGRRFSECPAPLLDQVAEMFDYFAEQAEQKHETYNGKAVAPFKRADAARARGWATRIRTGRHVQTSEPSTAAGHGDWAGSEDEAASEQDGWS
jgi:hypothetical protein